MIVIEKNQENIEREIIRKILISKELILRKILKSVSENMFLNPLYKSIVKNAKEVVSVGDFDINLLLDKMITNQKPKEATQTIFRVYEIANEGICTVNYKYYTGLLQKLYFERAFAQAKDEKEYEQIKLEKAYFMETEKDYSISADAEKIITDFYEKIYSRVETGYKEIDEMIGSFQAGDFVILAGATGMGKTCMALNLMNEMSKEHEIEVISAFTNEKEKFVTAGKKILYFSLEMKKAQLQKRFICSNCGLNVGDFRKSSLSDNFFDTFLNYCNSEEFKSKKINIIDEPNITVEDIKDIIKSFGNVDIVFIDYLGLINGDEKDINSYERLSNISRKLKCLALELEIPIIALHQLNRANADRKDKSPILSDLRDSGKIEQDADMILFVYRPYYYNKQLMDKADDEMLKKIEQQKDKIKLIVAKNRHGINNEEVELIYNPYHQRITSKLVQTESF